MFEDEEEDSMFHERSVWVPGGGGGGGGTKARAAGGRAKNVWVPGGTTGSRGSGSGRSRGGTWHPGSSAGHSGIPRDVGPSVYYREEGNAAELLEGTSIHHIGNPKYKNEKKKHKAATPTPKSKSKSPSSKSPDPSPSPQLLESLNTVVKAVQSLRDRVDALQKQMGIMQSDMVGMVQRSAEMAATQASALVLEAFRVKDTCSYIGTLCKGAEGGISLYPSWPPREAQACDVTYAHGQHVAVFGPLVKAAASGEGFAHVAILHSPSEGCLEQTVGYVAASSVRGLQG